MEMNDREMIEFAAKAAGLEFEFCRPEVGGCLLKTNDVHKWWNPIEVDGHALCLAVKLGISLDMTDCSAWIRTGNRFIEEFWSSSIPDYRRAIVRVAAEIGRSKK